MSGCLPSGLSAEPDAPLFPTMRHGQLTGPIPLPEANVYMMIQRRARAAGIRTKVSAHSFRATGITTYLQNGGKLEIAQQMAGHESARTTGLYDRRNDSVALDEVERIAYLMAGPKLYTRIEPHGPKQASSSCRWSDSIVGRDSHEW